MDGTNGSDPTGRKRFPAHPIILDATLRDGGYLNDWAFSPEQMFLAVEVLATIGIDIIEVGYLNQDPRLNLAYRCPVPLLSEIRRRAGSAKIAVMLNPANPHAKTLLKTRSGLIDLVRIPFDQTSLEKALTVANYARANGIQCSMNFISITACGIAEIGAVIRRITAENATDVLYLADSRGALLPREIEVLIRSVKDVWQGPLGFHAHDNLGFALTNTLAALNAGCTWVDGTVDGVGLGGGNTRLTELIERLDATHNALQDHVQAIAAVKSALNLKKPHELAEHYRLSGEKNLEQEWVPILLDCFKENTLEHMRRLAWDRYKQPEEILFEDTDCIQHVG